jgi:hypothetical protein
MVNKVDDLRLPEMPELTAGYLVVQKEAWSILTNYIKDQTSTINSLIDLVKSLAKLHDVEFEALKTQITTLSSEAADIAKALEGAYVDE